jgi:23S rRNA (adenine2503-C2)-methyltransferase
MHRNPWDPAKTSFSEYSNGASGVSPGAPSSAGANSFAGAGSFTGASDEASSSRPNFFSLTVEDLKAIFAGQGKEQFRSQQVFKWVYEKRITDPEKMTNLSKAFRAELGNLFDFSLPPVATHLKSIDGTQKFLFDMGQGMTVEAVLIPSDGRLTLCISSEIGCNMACRFCFTGKQKLKRRLQTGEIVGQFMQVHDRLEPDQRISNIVFMGMGEPLDNPEAVFKSIEILHSTWGMNVSKKTCDCVHVWNRA